MPEITAGEALLRAADPLAEWITEQQYSRQPDLMDRFGASGRIRTKMDSLYSLNYLAESVLVQSPVLFTHYVSWLKLLLEGYKVTGEDLRVNLTAMREAIEVQFQHKDKDLVLEYLDLGMNQALKTVISRPFITDDNPLAEEAKAYLQALLGGERRKASQLIQRLLERDIPIRTLYKYIFQVTQYEVGRLWHTGEINVAQEHFCTAATQSIISGLYPHWLGTGTKGLRLVAACVGEELHEIGLRMVADMFEMEGWDTYYLGANVPDSSLLKAIVEHRADVVAISATMTFHIHVVRDLIATIRRNPDTSRVKIMVGGLPFNVDPNLWKEVGADGCAPDAELTVREAERLVASVSEA